MPDQSIECPKCGAKIQLTDALRHQVEEQVRSKFEEQFSKKEASLSTELKKRGQELEKRESRLKRGEVSLEERIEKGIEERLGKIQEKAKNEAEGKVALDLKDKSARVEELSKEVDKYRESELDLRKRTRALEDKAREIDLEVERKLAGQKKAVEEKVRTEESEKREEQVRLKDEEIARLRKTLDQAQRIGTSGEMMGEVAEKTLEDRLRGAFPEDGVEAIGRGKPGADVRQDIQGGGSILWESKDHYPAWHKEWIPKLTKDRDDAKASVAVLVTTIGHDGKPLRAPAFYEGVVLTPPWAAVGVGSLLRPQLGELARQRRLYDKKETLQEAVYAWVTSDDFQRRATAIVKNLRNLQEQVDGARRNVVKWFTSMEREVDKTERSIAEFYDTARGRARLPDLGTLALKPGTNASEEDMAEHADGGRDSSTDEDEHAEDGKPNE